MPLTPLSRIGLLVSLLGVSPFAVSSPAFAQSVEDTPKPRASLSAKAAPAPKAQVTAAAPKARLVVTMVKGNTAAGVLSSVQSLPASVQVSGLKAVRQLSAGQAVLDRPQGMTRQEAQHLARELAKQPGVARVELDLPVRVLSSASSETLFDQQWPLVALNSGAPGSAGALNAPALWARTQGQGTLLAVLDTGMVAHPDLAGAQVAQFDFISDVDYAADGDARDGVADDPGDFCEENGELVSPSSWHGTKVAGLMSARWNGQGVAGLLPQSKLLNARVIGRCGGWLTDVADAVRWAAGAPVAGVPAHGQGVPVINLSLATEPGLSCPQYMQEAVSVAVNLGALVVASAGNESASTLGAPGNCSGVLAVAAHNASGDLADYSNNDPRIAVSGPAGGECASGLPGCLVAPVVTVGVRGQRTVEAYTQGSYMAGTSAAAPHVTAVLAAIKQEAPTLSAADALSWLKNHSRPFASGTLCAQNACGYGLLDAQLLFDQVDGMWPASLSVQAEPARARAGERVNLAARAQRGGEWVQGTNWRWTQVSGPKVTLTTNDSGSASFTAPSQVGTVTLRVQATVDARSEPSADVSVQVIQGTPPVLDFDQASHELTENETWTLKPRVNDAENDFVGLVVRQGPAGLVAKGAELTWLRPVAGEHTVVFAAVDADGLFSPDMELRLTVAEAPKLPGLEGSGGKGGGSAGGLAFLLAAALLVQRMRRRNAAQPARRGA